jgi:F-type H+-transporting ATPase subunit a
MQSKTAVRIFPLFLIAGFLLAPAGRTAAQEHPAVSPHTAADTAASLHQPGATAEHDVVHPAGHHPKDVHSLTPSDEMMRILEHKVENTPYIHEWPIPEIPLPENWIVNIGGTSINMSPSRHLVYMWIAMLLTIGLSMLAARQNARNKVPRGFGNMMESVIVFIRDEVASPFLGKDTARYMPILMTFFFFISTMNLVGLLPFGATATGNINITAGLAIITFALMIGGGMRANGPFGYFKGLVPHGMPAPLLVIMVPIELMGLFTKPFALTIRLFANMLSGGLVIGAFYALIFGMDTIVVAPLSIVFLLFMSLLKIFVCLLQAYIFTMLSSFFIGMSVHQSH